MELAPFTPLNCAVLITARLLLIAAILRFKAYSLRRKSACLCLRHVRDDELISGNPDMSTASKRRAKQWPVDKDLGVHDSKTNAFRGWIIIRMRTTLVHHETADEKLPSLRCSSLGSTYAPFSQRRTTTIDIIIPGVIYEFETSLSSFQPGYSQLDGYGIHIDFKGTRDIAPELYCSSHYSERDLLPSDAGYKCIRAKQTISIHITNRLLLQVCGPPLKLLNPKSNAVQNLMLDIARRQNQMKILRKRKRYRRRAAIWNYGENW
ncbi:hypothetical protein BDP55DRAFT_758048 [Colletotrichum godetiae]|uniref:Uncharacterized protein n=1 Tax=Colletotrichum godetiae TaxID=1209918 RepID=A0AAJ0AT84_9PEZI|nr:uncharacterized protein BDP55DRAFT_758048 [Colletotrichum godetiae]KAK1689939.1 hypothetical protein BDP55DRAFT_758048 [Colletotrichum godetiae]